MSRSDCRGTRWHLRWPGWAGSRPQSTAMIPWMFFWGFPGFGQRSRDKTMWTVWAGWRKATKWNATFRFFSQKQYFCSVFLDYEVSRHHEACWHSPPTHTHTMCQSTQRLNDVSKDVQTVGIMCLFELCFLTAVTESSPLPGRDSLQQRQINSKPAFCRANQCCWMIQSQRLLWFLRHEFQMRARARTGTQEKPRHSSSVYLLLPLSASRLLNKSLCLKDKFNFDNVD